MTKINQIWKCEICGNVIEVLHEGVDSLVCCNQPMKLFQEKTEDEGQEKHVPVIEGKKVRVGSIEHPMEEKHYIEWIEAEAEDGTKSRFFLKPGQKPEAEFCFEIRESRIYCNIHGLWKNK
jgi:superoxide reductase